MVYLNHLKHCKKFNLLTLICLLVFNVIPTIYGLAFLHSTIGVVFSPYVRHEINYENVSIDWTSYTINDIKTMAKVISTRFPKLVTYGIGSIYTGGKNLATGL